MKKTNHYTLFACFAICLLAACQEQPNLTFGEGSGAWTIYGAAEWDFSGQQLTGQVKDSAGFVITQQTFDDFELEIEFKPDSSINSGVFIRCTQPDAINPTDCYEMNIWDLHPNQDNRTGTIVNRLRPAGYVETINKWNTYNIKAEGQYLNVWINDTLTASARSNDLRSGYIGLQARGTGTIQFRNLKIKPIKNDE